jgi:hypothetical protein
VSRMHSKTLAASIVSTIVLHDTIMATNVTAHKTHHHCISDRLFLSDLSPTMAMPLANCYLPCSGYGR